VPAVLLLGLAFGALTSSFIVSDDDVRSVALLSPVLALASAIMVWLGKGLWGEARPLAAERYEEGHCDFERSSRPLPTE